MLQAAFFMDFTGQCCIFPFSRNLSYVCMDKIQVNSANFIPCFTLLKLKGNNNVQWCKQSFCIF